MSPSYSTKREVRYRFYVSSAILSGRHEQAGSVTRAAAPDLEQCIVAALRKRFPHIVELKDQDLVNANIERVTVNAAKIQIFLNTNVATEGLIELARPRQPPSPRTRIEEAADQPVCEPADDLVHALTRAFLWRKALSNRTYQSVEELAVFAKWNPKVVRKALRLAFLAPEITEAIMLGTQPMSLSVSKLQGIATYSWAEQRRLLGLSAGSQ